MATLADRPAVRDVVPQRRTRIRRKELRLYRLAVRDGQCAGRTNAGPRYGTTDHRPDGEAHGNVDADRGTHQHPDLHTHSWAHVDAHERADGDPGSDADVGTHGRADPCPDPDRGGTWRHPDTGTDAGADAGTHGGADPDPGADPSSDTVQPAAVVPQTGGDQADRRPLGVVGRAQCGCSGRRRLELGLDPERDQQLPAAGQHRQR
jgi:hypothetical protein